MFDVAKTYSLLAEIIVKLFAYAGQLFVGLNMKAYLFGGFAIVVIYRLLLSRLVNGSAGSSDKASKKSKGKQEGD